MVTSEEKTKRTRKWKQGKEERHREKQQVCETE